MNLDEFMEFTKANDEQAYAILGKANQEYARVDNKFENFDTVAAFFNANIPEFEGKFKPKHVAIVYFLKHFISIMKGVSIREDMSGRYQDAMNYIRLMQGMDERDARVNHQALIQLGLNNLKDFIHDAGLMTTDEEEDLALDARLDEEHREQERDYYSRANLVD